MPELCHLLPNNYSLDYRQCYMILCYQYLPMRALVSIYEMVLNLNSRNLQRFVSYCFYKQQYELYYR